MDVEENLAYLPSKLNNVLMPFQREGIRFALRKGGRCLIADEMGLGKTIQAISVAYYYRLDWPLLIIVPSSLRYPWIEELEKWLPEIHPHDINLIQGGTDIGGIPKSQITVTTFGLLRHPASKVVQEALMNQRFKVIIVDESHYMKNRKTATTKYLVPLLQQAQHRILLTGTPALARPEELYPQLSCIDSKLFKNWTNFANRYCDARYQWFGRIKKWVTDGASNLEELQNILTTHLMIRRLKKDVLTQLPAKQRQKIPFQLKDSHIKKELDGIFEEMGKIMGRNNTNLAQVLQRGAPAQDNGERGGGGGTFEIYKYMSQLYTSTCAAKIGPVKEYVKMLCDNEGLKFIIFAYHHIMMDSVSEQLLEDNVKFIRIDGSTVQQDRPRLVHQFQVDKTTRVAILSMKAAGVGLTLTAAKLVVFAELDWTPGTMEQCEDRAHRIGQKDTVHVHYLVAKGTLDEWVWSALARKTSVVTTTLNGERQVLRMDEGNKGQIDVLANAEAFVPTEKTYENLSAFFQSQQGSAQKTIKDFFTPKGSKKSPRGKSKLTNSKGGENGDRIINDLDIVSPGMSDFHSGSKKRKLKAIDDMNDTFEEAKEKSQQDLVVEEEIIDLVDDDMPVIEPLKKRKCLQKEEKNISYRTLTEETEANDNGHKKLEWSCTRCTFLNHIELPLCEMCSMPKPKVLRSTKKETSKPSPFEIAKTNSARKRAKGGRQSVSCKEQILISEDENSNSLIVDKDVEPRHLSDTVIQNDDNVEESEISMSISSELLQNDEAVCDHHADNKRSSSNCEHPSKDEEIEQPLIKVIESIHKKDHSISDSESETENLIDELPFDSNVNKSKPEKKSRKSFQFFSQDSDPELPDNKVKKVTVVPNSNSNSYDGSADLFDSSDRGIPSDEDHNDNTKDLSYNEFSIECNESNDKGLSDRESIKDDTPVKSVINCLKSEQPSPYTPKYNMLKSSQESASSSSSSSRKKFTFKKTPNTRTKNMSESATATPERSSKSIGAPQTPKQSHLKSPDPMTPESIADEMAAAKKLFSPRTSKKSSTSDVYPWQCKKCETVNDGDADDCEGCLASRPTSPEITIAKPTTERIVNLDRVPVHVLFQFCCSKNTSRIYLYNKEGFPLEVNFVPLDVELDNHSELPDLLLHPQNLKLVKKFVREWNSLSATKKRIIVKSGEIFVSPLQIYEELKSGKSKSSTQRYMNKADVAAASISKAEEVGGSVRLIHKPSIPSKKGKGEGKATTSTSTPLDGDLLANNNEEEIQKMKGLVQAIDADGRPLCVFCQKPYENILLTKATLSSNPWFTRFCSKECMNQYWMRSHRGYGRQQVYDLEHGVCQICGLDADTFFRRIKNMTDHKKRAKLIKESKYNCLKSDTKEKMVKNPVKGQFWHVDHIQAVTDGGGECDIDNLRTLCTVCHRDVTSQQNKDRRQRSRLQAAAGSGDISAFFKPH